MKNIFIFACITSIAFLSCRKDTITPQVPIADMKFKLHAVRAPGDTMQYDVYNESTFILKSDYTWTLNLEGVESYGTYTWSPSSNVEVSVSFTITKWTDFTPNLVLSDKLKSVIPIVKLSGYSVDEPVFANFRDDTFN